jgi:hypothetical protein
MEINKQTNEKNQNKEIFLKDKRETKKVEVQF